MSRILLVDDQPEVLTGLRTFLDALFEDIEVLEAHDGAQGYALALEALPDIIVADVMMPGMDGLQMIRQLKRDGVKSHVIILSAHERFDYAQQAIALGVDEYIVKPVTQRQLYLSVAKLLRAIQHEGRRDVYSDVLLNEYLSGADVFLPEEAVFSMSGLSAMERPLWYIALYQSARVQSPETLATLLLDMGSLLEGQGLSTYLYHTYGRCIVVLVNLAEDALEGGFAALRILSESLPEGYCTGVSSPGEGRASLCTLYRQAEIAVDNAARMAVSFIAYDHSATEGAVIGHHSVDRLIAALQAGDRVETWTLLDKLLARLTLQGVPVDACRAELASLVRALDALFCPDAQDLADALLAIDRTGTLFGLKRIIHERAAKWLLPQAEASRGGYPPAIAAAIDHIHAHLSQPMTVAELANTVNLSYYYFSALFARSTGLKVRAFMLDARLTQAALLLRRNGTLRVGDIAQQCGFENVRYFSVCFKRKYQQTPQQYRANP